MVGVLKPDQKLEVHRDDQMVTVPMKEEEGVPVLKIDLVLEGEHGSWVAVLKEVAGVLKRFGPCHQLVAVLNEEEEPVLKSVLE